jgi:4-carboxymuconolactone decarboxylase
MNREKYEKGMAVRREVLGDEYVDKALAGATDFTKPLQDLVAENCWGEVWTREAISKKTRSLVTIAILAALRAPAEIKLHVRGALRNGCTVEEIQDVLLQATVYCGVPAGVDAFRAAKDVIDPDLLGGMEASTQ